MIQREAAKVKTKSGKPRRRRRMPGATHSEYGSLIEMACRLLQRSDMRIEDVAQQTGFGSGNYFSRIFKSIVGVSPKDYRKEQNIGLLTQREAQELIVRYEMLE